MLEGLDCGLLSAASERALSDAGRVIVPAEATPGLLMSMAMRYDHGLGVPGYYDGPLFKGSCVTHAQRLQAAITTARQMHEEVVGNGFYQPEREDDYRAMVEVAREEEA